MTMLPIENFKTRESGFLFAYAGVSATDKRTFYNGRANDFTSKPQETWAFLIIRDKP